MEIPTEGYGFSNDAYGTFGPKDFEERLFAVNGYTKITLKTEYYKKHYSQHAVIKHCADSAIFDLHNI